MVQSKISQHCFSFGAKLSPENDDPIRSGDYAYFPPQPPGSLLIWGAEWPNLKGLYKENIFMKNYIEFLNK